MKLRSFILALESAYPLTLAADWDPAGMQVEPERNGDVQRILLTLDVTTAVVREAKDKQIDLIIAYHPPLFAMPDRLTQTDPKARILMSCIQAGMAVYSPHTVLDATPGGVTDWLAATLGEGSSERIEPVPDHPDAGHGRLITLKETADAETLARRIQSALQIPWVRTACPSTNPEPIRTVAVCPGAGHSLIENAEADALLTGEMRHHDLLTANEKGQTVFLCEHAASERGYLSVYAEALRGLIDDGVTVDVSESDAGPLHQIVCG